MKIGLTYRLMAMLCWPVTYIVPLHIHAQAKVQVVIKTIEKNLKCDGPGSLRIMAEKAEISIHGWNKKNMHLVVKLISKNNDRQIAEQELEYLHFACNQEADVVELSDFFVLPDRKTSVRSSITAKYDIWVPMQYIISLKNRFGAIHLDNLNTRTMVDAEYSNISADNYTGYLSVNSDYSDVKATNINADFDCTADHADIVLNAMGGSYHIDDQFGNITITEKKVVNQISIKSIRTKVQIITNGMQQYAFDLSAGQANIILPGKQANALIKKTGNRMVFELKRKGLPQITVSTTHEDIVIK